MPLFVVDTIVQFRDKYVIEAKTLQDAYAEVNMRDFKSDEEYFYEMSQRFLGETIVNGMEITQEQFDKLLESVKNDSDEMSSHWLGNELIRKVKYEE